MDISKQSNQAYIKPLKRLRWSESAIEYNKPGGFSSVQVKPKKEVFNPKEVVATLNKFFTKHLYKEANSYIISYGDSHQIQILITENYALFKRAALRSDLRTLQFIHDKVGDDLTKKMIEDNEYSALENFLTNECAPKNEKTYRNNRINILRFFIQLCKEDIKAAFEKNLENFKISEDVKNDFQKEFEDIYINWKNDTKTSLSPSPSFIEKYRHKSSSSSLTI